MEMKTKIGSNYLWKYMLLQYLEHNLHQKFQQKYLKIL